MARSAVFERSAPGVKTMLSEGAPSAELPRSYFQAHIRPLTAMVNALGKISPGIIAKTDLLRRPASHADLSEFYLVSRIVNEEITNVTILPSPIMWQISLSCSLMDQRLTFAINLKPSLEAAVPGFTDKTSWEDFLHVYLYFTYCASGINQNHTAFIHIDNDEMFRAARAKVQKALDDGDSSIVREFPTVALLYLYGSPKMTLGYTSGKVHTWNPTAGKEGKGGWEQLKTTFAVDKVAGYFPEPDMRGIVEKTYILFAYLLLTQEVVTLDTETTGLDYRTSQIVSCGLALDTHLGFYISINHRQPATRQITVGEKGFIRGAAYSSLLGAPNASKTVRDSLFSAQQVICDNSKNMSMECFKEVLAIVKTKKVIYHNAKFDFSMVYCHTAIRLPLYFDTMLAHYVTRPGFDDKSKDKRNLQFIAVNELGILPWKGDITKCQAEPKDIVGAYNVRDCCYTQGISYVLWPDIAVAPKLFWDIEMKFLEPLIFAELEGLNIDKAKLAAIKVALVTKMDNIEKGFQEITGNPDFNINSGPQLMKLFWETLGVKPLRRCRKCTFQHQTDSDKCPECGEDSPIKRLTASGKPALDKWVLADLAKFKVAGAQMLLDHRAAGKTVSAYTNLPDKVNALTGRIHPQYFQSRVVTGRLSSGNPNSIRGSVQVETLCGIAPNSANSLDPKSDSTPSQAELKSSGVCRD